MTMMEEPERLLAQDDLLPEARDLLAALAPSPAMPSAVRADLDLRIDEVAQLPAGPAVGPWSWGGPALLGAVVGVGVMAGLSALEPTAPALGGAPTAAPIERVETRGYATVRLVPSPAPTPAAVAPIPRAEPRSVVVADPAATLAEELRILGAAKASLPTRPAQALAQVDLHARRFPAGQLSDMRELVRLRALKGLDSDRVRPLAERFLSRYPNSAFRKDVLELRATLE